MSYLIVAVVFVVLGFIAGLLVGKKNPNVANTANTVAQDVDNLLKKQS
jgi:uncharacterized protein YoxC